MTPRRRAALLAGMAVVALGAVTAPFVAHHTRPGLADLLAGLIVMWCGTDLLGSAATRAQGWLLCAAGTSWFVPDLGVTGVQLVDAVLQALVLLHVPLLVAAVQLAPSGALDRLPGRVSVVAAAVSAATAVTGGHTVALGATGVALLGATANHWRLAHWSAVRPWRAYLGAACGYGAVLTAASAVRLTGSGPGEAAIATTYDVMVATAAVLLVVVGPWLRREYAIDVGPDGLAALDGLEVPSGSPGRGSADPLLVEGRTLVSRNRALRAAALARVRDLEALRLRLVSVQSEERRALVARLAAGPLERLARIEAELEVSAVPDEMVDGVRRTREELRRLAEGLDPLGSRGDLAAALETLVGRAGGRVRYGADPVDLDPEVGRALWFACAEALANGAKHAPGSTVEVVLSSTADTAVLTISDNGPGGADPDGAGLRGVADRVAAVGGRCEVRTGPLGTTLTLRAPGLTAQPRRPDDPGQHVPTTRADSDVRGEVASLASMTPTTEVSP